jgi:hypothetical protein
MTHLLNVVSVAGLVLLAAVLISLRKSHIRVEHSVSWLAAAVALIILSRSKAALLWLTGALGVSDPPLALIMMVFCVFLVVLYRFSAIISELKDANIAVTQRLAILEYRLEALDHERQQALH